MRTPHGERLFIVIGIPIDVTRYRPDAWLDDTPASGTAQRQAPWDRSTSVVGQRHYAVEEVFPHRAVSGPTQHLCMPVGKGRLLPFAC